LDTQFRQQLAGNPFLAPYRILPGHSADQLTQLEGNPRSAGSTLPPPEQAPPGAVPSDHRLRLHYKQRIPPVEEPRQDRQADPGSGVDPARLDTALFEQRQRPPKK